MVQQKISWWKYFCSHVWVPFNYSKHGHSFCHLVSGWKETRYDWCRMNLSCLITGPLRKRVKHRQGKKSWPWSNDDSNSFKLTLIIIISNPPSRKLNILRENLSKCEYRLCTSSYCSSCLLLSVFYPDTSLSWYKTSKNMRLSSISLQRWVQ